MKKLDALGIACGQTMTAGKIEAARKEDLPESVLSELRPRLTLNRAAIKRIKSAMKKIKVVEPVNEAEQKEGKI